MHEVDLGFVFSLISYVGRLFVKSSGKPVEVLMKLNAMAGYAPEEDIELYEVCFLSIFFLDLVPLNQHNCPVHENNRNRGLAW